MLEVTGTCKDSMYKKKKKNNLRVMSKVKVFATADRTNTADYIDPHATHMDQKLVV